MVVFTVSRQLLRAKVRDQDEALQFWTAKVGFEVKVDVTMAEMGDFRWLAGPPR